MRNSFKGLRRSLKGEKDGNKNATVSVGAVEHTMLSQKPPMTIIPPKKVIRALHDYAPRSDSELGFRKGDFFHVIGNEDDTEWYEACNPSTNIRGLVPVTFFQVLHKSETGSSEGRSRESSYGSVPSTSRRVSDNKNGLLYGVVQYDFKAERQDELEAKRGESIIIIARSNHEWFVAKPIERLGGPGLIPISYIELRDMATGQAILDPEESLAKAAVPRVDEWKKSAMDYKASSIPLGKFESESQPSSTQTTRLSMNDRYSNGTRVSSYQKGRSTSSQQSTRKGFIAVVSASIESYGFDDDRYWYLLKGEMEDGRHRNLCRYYEDFYDCQIALLDEFPDEAGRNGAERSLPFMPGPLTYVNDSISMQRRANLDEYIHALIRMPHNISRSDLVKQLFLPRDGDVESTHTTTQLPQPPRLSKGRAVSSQRSNSFARNAANIRPSISLNESRAAALQGRQIGRSSSSQHEAPPMTRTGTSMTNDSTSSALGNNGSNPAFIKIKVFYQDDLIALRLPKDVTYDQLTDKLHERIGSRYTSLKYKDEINGNYADLRDEADLIKALDRYSKLILYAQ